MAFTLLYLYCNAKSQTLKDESSRNCGAGAAAVSTTRNGLLCFFTYVSGNMYNTVVIEYSVLQVLPIKSLCLSLLISTEKLGCAHFSPLHTFKSGLYKKRRGGHSLFHSYQGI